MTPVRNNTAFYVTKQRVAHKPDYAASAQCGQVFRPGEIRRMTYAQLLVFVKPNWCRHCFRDGAP